LKQIQFQNNDLNLIYDIINLLTGYDISTSYISNIKSDKLLEKLFTLILININKYLTTLAKFNVKSISDAKFQSTIINLLCAISGIDREKATKDKKDTKTGAKPGRKIIAIQKSIEEKKEEEPPAKVLFPLPITVIEAVFKIAQFDSNAIETLLGNSKIEGYDSQKARIFTKMKEEVYKMKVYGKTEAMETVIAKPKAGESELSEILKKIQNGTATTHEVFVATDREGDSSGSISKQEFAALARRLNINLTDHRVNEIFTNLKKSGTSEKDEELTEEEFAKALQYLNQKSTNMTLEALGISQSLLIVALVSLIIVLLLIFVFIFLGIQGFAVGSSFGSVVNSILPIGIFFLGEIIDFSRGWCWCWRRQG